MLRVHLVQLCYNLSDPGMEDLLYEAESVRRFVGVRLSEPLPDESTILHFRHLLERHHLGQELFAEINGHLAAQGVRLQEGTIVDATIIAAPTSTKNRSGQRRKLAPGSLEAQVEKAKASIRAKVEHPFLDVKQRFNYAKVRYRGLAKNTERIAILLGLSNLTTAQRAVGG